MHFPSIRVGILLVLAILFVQASAAPKKKPPPPPSNIPEFSEPHRINKDGFEYCKKYAWGFKKFPSANINDFNNLCDNIPNNFTLPAMDPYKAKEDACQRFSNGTANAQFCNFDLCRERKLDNQQSKCREMVLGCFGSKNGGVSYTAGYTRSRNPMGYRSLWVNESTSAITDLEPTCNGLPAPEGKKPENPIYDWAKPDPREWEEKMRQLVSNKGV